MLRRTAIVVGFAEAFLVVLAPRAKAGPITDFSPLTTWSLDYCFTKYWNDNLTFSTTSTACVDGQVNFGYSASMGYGYTYNFEYTTPTPAPPSGSRLTVSLDCLNFTETPATAGDCPGASNGPGFLGSGQFFNPMSPFPGPAFDENSSLTYAEGDISWVDTTAPPVCGLGCAYETDLDFFVAPVVVAPEPSTIVLVISGLGLFGVMSRRRRVRRLRAPGTRIYCVSDLTTITVA